MDQLIVPIILCGGGGTRLWPLSTERRPKPFLPLTGPVSPFAATLERIADETLFARPLIVANHAHRGAVAAALESSGVEATLLLEPEPHNTAPAIAAAIARLGRDRDPIVLVVAADHLIRDVDGFRATVRSALPAADAGYLVVFGITPTEPATGYGYIRRGHPLAGIEDVAAVAAFVEKPDAPTARRYVDAGYLWNSGNFMMRAAAARREFERHAPTVYAAAARAVAEATPDAGAYGLAPGPFAEAAEIPFDRAVMEKTGRAAVIEAGFDWCDLGTWSSIWAVSHKDAAGNALQGRIAAIDAHGNYGRTDGPAIGIIGVNNTVVVAGKDAVLVAAIDHADAVRDIAGALGASDERPKTGESWGWTETLVDRDSYAVKRVIINAGMTMLDESAAGSSEHWTVVGGSADVSPGSHAGRLSAGQTFRVAPGGPRRIANPGKVPAVLVLVVCHDTEAAHDDEPA